MTAPITFHRYTLPALTGVEGWGIFLIDSTGMFAAVTDYGNYAYKWSNYGNGDFRKFVIDIARSPDYVVEKLCQDYKKEYRGAETFKSIKEYIIESRRYGSLTKNHAREEWNILCDPDYEELSYIETFHDWYQKTTIEYASEFPIYDYPRSAYAMAQKLLPRLAVIIQQELEQSA